MAIFFQAFFNQDYKLSMVANTKGCLWISQVNATDGFIIIVMLNKYKYSLNRGLKINSLSGKRGIRVNTYAIVSHSSPTLYDISINEGGTMVVLYNDHEYMHRQCTLATNSHNQQMLNQTSPHFIATHNNLTIFVCSQPLKSQEIVMGFQNNSLLHQTFNNLKKGKQATSKIGLSVVGVKSQNILTDQLDQSAQLESYNGLQTIRPIMRLRNVQSCYQKYMLQGLTRRYVEDQKNLEQVIIQYKQKKNSNEYMTLGEERVDWDWLQAELFILNQYNPDDQSVLKSHYLLKVNQYLQTTSSLMLKLGITLRKLQQKVKAVETSETKLFKLLSNCWIRPKSLQTIHLFVQIGHQLTLKEEYLNLVPTSEVTVSSREGKDIQQLSFFYIKNYQNYPKITSLISKLNKENSKGERAQTSVRAYSSRMMEWGKLRSKSYARDTLSSIQKKRVNNILQQFEQTQAEQNKNLQQIIQEAASLYKQPNPNFRLSYHKQSNIQALRKHKKFIQTLNATNPSHLFHSQRMKSQNRTKQPIRKTNNSKWQSNNVFEMYTKSKRTRNFRKQKQIKEGPSINKGTFEQKGEQVIMFDKDSDRLF